MSMEVTQHFQWELEGSVAVLDVLSAELNQPQFARELESQLSDLIDSRPAPNVLIDFKRTKYMSSTSFGAIFNIIKEARAVGIHLALCGMDQNLRFGADILSLGQYIPIYSDRAAAIASIGVG